MSKELDALTAKVAGAMMRSSHRRYWPLGQLTESGVAFEIQRDGSPWVCEARAAILAVLDHFSEPGNVTDGMAKASLHALIDFVESEEDNERDKIAQAMRAARDELRGGM